METNNLVLIEQFCACHNIEFSFINSLQEFGLIEIVIVDESKYLPFEHLPKVEKMVRLHYDLNINMEGIDAISGLLKRINDLQHKLISAQNKLRLYEED